MLQQTILIVEDDAVLMRGLTDNFQRQGFAVRQACDGQIGLSQVLTNPPDIVVLDVMLPHLSGYDLCRQVRRHQLRMPIMMLTAKGEEQDIVRGLELGADDYVTKPFGIREVMARVRALLRRDLAFDSKLVTLGETQFDRESRQLIRHGVEIELTRKEFELLSLFLARPNRALTRREIMDRVWGASAFVTSRSVDRCVTTLRAKLEADPRQPRLIQTIREIGYRFDFPPN